MKDVNQNSNSTQQISGKLSEMVKEIFDKSGIIARWNSFDANVHLEKPSAESENAIKPKKKEDCDFRIGKRVDKEILIKRNDHTIEAVNDTDQDIAEYNKGIPLLSSAINDPELADKNDSIGLKNNIMYDNTKEQSVETYAGIKDDFIEKKDNLDDNIDEIMNVERNEDALHFDHTKIKQYERAETANNDNIEVIEEAITKDQPDDLLDTSKLNDDAALSNSEIKDDDLLKNLITDDDNWIDCSDNEENQPPPNQAAARTSKSNLRDKYEDSSHSRIEIMPF